MKKTALFLLLLAHLLGLRSQSTDLTLLYRLTEAEAETIYRENALELDSTHFHTYVDSFRTREYPGTLAPGHYLLVSAEWEELVCRLQDRTTIGVQLIPDRRDLVLQVLDSAGQLVTDADLRLARRRIPYDPDTQTYRWKKRKKGGFLRVRARGETAFFSIEKESVYPYRGRFFYTRTGRLITTPYRWGRSVYHYFRQGFGNGYWRIDFDRLIPHRWRNRDRDWQGYLAFNQPKYRAGDTLRVKAFVTKPNGRPWRREAEMQIRSLQIGALYDAPLSFGDRTRRSPVADSLLAPNRPGNFTFEMVLGDSLTIDETYFVSFDHPKRTSIGGLQKSFYLEDYQLDEAVYSLKPEKETCYASDTIVLIVEAKDRNDLPAAGVEALLVAKRGQVSAFWAEEVHIPDTLWTRRQPLDAAGSTRIVFPDSLLPAASLAVQIHATFTNAKGEIQTRSAGFTYQRDTAYLRVWEEDGYVNARYYRNGAEQPRRARLAASHYDLDIYREQPANLPYRERIDPQMQTYRFSTDSLDYELDVATVPSGVEAGGYHTRDSVFLRLQNPKRIPVYYRVGPRGRAVAEGRTEWDQFQWAGPVPAGTAYFLEYEYVWGGRGVEESVPIEFYEKLLDVRLDYPGQVVPGQKVDFKVTVQDAARRAVAGVDLTAGAVNAQFDRDPPYDTPDITYNPARKPRTYGRFYVEERDLTRQKWEKELAPRWVEKLRLRDSLFYRLRYAGEGIYLEYDSIATDTFYRQVAQFAPYIVRNGRSQPVILIYCNRQLVYYYGVGDQPPYSFAGPAGYNSLIIRTPEYEYILDSVLLKNGHKLEIAIDEERFRFSPLARHLRRRPMPDELEYAERELLNRRIVQLRQSHSPSDVFLWQDSLQIHRLPGGRSYPLAVGPFRDGETLHFRIPGGWDSEFLFEPGFRYVLQADREKLYHAPLFEPGDKAALPRRLSPRPVGELIYSPRILDSKPDPLAGYRPGVSYLPAQGDRRDAGEYQFFYRESAEEPLLALALVFPDSAEALFYPTLRQFSPLPPGAYELIFLNRKGHFATHTFEAPRNGLLYQHLDRLQWFPDTTGRFRQLFRLPGAENVARAPSGPAATGFRYDYTNSYGPGYRLSGVVTDENGEPLIGASILIKGFSIGTVTDFDGRYELTIPEGIRAPEIIVSYVGFTTREVAINAASGPVNVSLAQNLAALDEVVVTALGVSRGRGRAVSTVPAGELTGGLQGRMAGVAVREYDDVRTREIAALRGSRSDQVEYFVDGRRVPDIGNLRPEDILDIELLQDPSATAGYGVRPGGSVVLITTRANLFALDQTPSGIRADFRDYAFWEPELITDRNGQAFFSAVFPDNLTSWDAFIVGMDGRKRAGVNRANIRSYKPVTGQLAVPRFLVGGDETQVVGAAVNYTGDSLTVRTQFLLGGEIIQQREEQKLGENLVEKALVRAGADTLELTYKLETADYFDGEQRSIPTIPRGMFRQEGQFWAVSRDTAFTYRPDPQLGPVQLYVQSDLLPMLLEDIEYLRNYPYGCNEQNASRLIALLLEKDIRKKLGQPFRYEKDIARMIERLENAQNEDGSWGWWSGNRANEWMSIYVLRALSAAKGQGYANPAVEKGLRRLTNRLFALSKEERLSALELLSELGQRFAEKELAYFDTLALDLTDRLRLIRIRQLQDLPYPLDTLQANRRESLLGGQYWEDKPGRWYGEITAPTLLAYRILEKEGDGQGTERIRQYFLESRARYGRHGWRNTFETAQILQAILPDLAGAGENQTAATLRINGEPAAGFPMRRALPADAPVSISKSGSRPLFLTAYQEAFLSNPVARRDLFDIRTQLLQDGNPVGELTAGTPATLRVEMEVKKASPYVMIEVPIPAGCSYFTKSQGRWGAPESHREYFKDRVAIFCEQLPPGLHRFEIELEPRFAGSYTLNPARAEQMYFPVLGGNGVVKRVSID